MPGTLNNIVGNYSRFFDEATRNISNGDLKNLSLPIQKVDLIYFCTREHAEYARICQALEEFAQPAITSETVTIFQFAVPLKLSSKFSVNHLRVSLDPSAPVSGLERVSLVIKDFEPFKRLFCRYYDHHELFPKLERPEIRLNFDNGINIALVEDNLASYLLSKAA